MPRSLDFEYILTPGGLESHRRLVIDDAGIIAAVEPAPTDARDGWFAMPGMPNAHSHAFQRAMAGQGEAAAGEDSFWSWREYMYGLARVIGPDDLYAIGRRAFADMLHAGFTSVGEFHYLHHLPEGTPSPAMGQALIAAARDVGIRLVFLPVYYRMGGFDKPAGPAQQRFLHESPAAFADYLAQFTGQACGIAPHSLRAVPVTELAELLELATTVLEDACPVHIHIAEQRAEVRECRKSLGAPPIRALHDMLGLNERWSLVHATHADAQERQLMFANNVNLVLCPLTEAYLGDGVFPATEYASAGGHFAVGSDSNIRIDAIEELRVLEYGQRLTAEKRARLSDASGIGIPLWRKVAAAGAKSLGLRAGKIAPGCFADLVVLDQTSSPIAGVAPERVPDAWLTGGSRENIHTVYVGGKARVRAGRAHGDAEIAVEYAKCLDSLRMRMQSGVA